MTAKRKSIVAMSALAGAVAIVVVIGVVLTHDGSAPPPIETPSPELAKYVATDAFRKLSTDQKEPYVRKLENAYFDDDPDQFRNLTRDEAMAVWRNMMEAALDVRMKDYFSRRTQAEREAHLDKEIDLMQQRVAAGLMRMLRGATPSQPPSPDSAARPVFTGPRQGISPQQQKDRLETTDSTKLAMMADYMSAMRARAQERGIPIGMPQPR